MKIVIVGGGAAGIATANSIRNIEKESEVVIISEEEVVGYNRPLLTKSISKDFDVASIAIESKEWYQEQNIDLRLAVEVKSIYRDLKKIKLSDGETISYDKLILATGASSFVPPVPGADLDGVYTIRTHKNILDIQNRIKNAKNAIVVGGGVLGLEAADDLKKVVDHVTILERSNGLMSKQLDAVGSQALKEAADKMGIEVMYEVSTREIVGDGEGNVRGVFLESGLEIPADIVIFSTGIVPNKKLAEVAGLEVGRAIKVNECCLTSDNSIFAVGDCAEFNGIDYAILPQALEMGRVAGINAVTDSCDEKYFAVAPSNMYNGMGILLFAIGDNGKNPDLKYEVVENEGERFYYAGDKFVGATLINNLSKVPKIIEGYKTGKYENE